MKKRNKFAELSNQCESAIKVVKAAASEGDSQAIARTRAVCEAVLRKLDETLADLQRKRNSN
jgi:hypothetical protein